MHLRAEKAGYRLDGGAYHLRMINVIPSNARHHADHGWLNTHWHFSFSDYHDPNNMNWGALRVFNDDVVRVAADLGAHGHRDMEIMMHVLRAGEWTIWQQGRDRAGRGAGVGGQGIVHAEYNHSKTVPVHFPEVGDAAKSRQQAALGAAAVFASRTRGEIAGCGLVWNSARYAAH